MAAPIKLTVRNGVSPAQEYVFSVRTTCMVGRGSDCSVRLPNDPLHWGVSRHHCLLDIDPPLIRVRDLGSRNGTYVNGRLIGQRADTTAVATGSVVGLSEVNLLPGDEIQVGATVLHVSLGAEDDTAQDIRLSAPEALATDTTCPSLTLPARPPRPRVGC
jgi:pSer/pThr/pTyr-binding forkhead associated (FHA) protein